MKFGCYFIVFSFFLQVLDANQIQLCHTNPCQNGGDCYIIGDSVEHSNCEDGWTLYRRICYKLVQSAQLWSDAFRNCRSSQSNLLSIENQVERIFVKEFAKEELKLSANQNSGKLPFNIWTSGKLFDNNDYAAIWTWLKSDNNETIDLHKQYWKSDYQNPIKIPENGDACISIGSSTNYTDWLVDSCEQKRNYFMCEKPEQNIVEPNGYYDYQCRCKPGFVGFNCEIAVTSYISNQQQICDAESLKFNCQSSGSNKQLIVVDYASYGLLPNSTSKKCPGGKTDNANTDCVADNSLKLIAKHCQGQMSCALPMAKKLFPVNPCLPGTSGLTLEYRLRCVEEEMTCPSETVQHNKLCYEVVYRDDRSSRKSWADARKFCQSKGGDLIGPVDSATHDSLANALHQKDERKVKYFWIGLKMNLDYRSQQTNGYFVNGAPMEYSPEGSRLEDDECVAYYVQPPSRIVWIAKNCNYFYNWICQYSLSGPERPKLQDPLWVKPTEHTVSPDEETEFTTVLKSTKVDSNVSPALTSEADESAVTETTTQAYSPTEFTTLSRKRLTTPRIRTTVDYGEYYTQQRTTRRATRRTTLVPRTRTTTHITRPTTPEEQVSADITEIPPEESSETTSVSSELTHSGKKSSVINNRKFYERKLLTQLPNKLPLFIRVWSVTGSTEQSSTFLSSAATSTVSTTTAAASTVSITSIASTSTIPSTTAPATTSKLSTTLPDTTTPGSTTIAEKSSTTIQQSSRSSSTVKTTSPQTTHTLRNHTSTDWSNGYEGWTQFPTTLSFYTDNNAASFGICYNKTVRNIFWPNTFESQIATVVCPGSKHRFAYWGCIKDNNGETKFYPENPDLSDCRNDQDLDALRNQIESDENAFKITSDLAIFWEANKRVVYGGDIYASLYMIRDIINLQRRQLQKLVLSTNPYEKQAVSTKFTQKLGSIVDVLLSSEVIPIWNDLPGNYKHGNATVLMYNLEDNADMLAYYLESTSERNFTFNSLNMKVEVYRQAASAAVNSSNPMSPGSRETFQPPSVQGDHVPEEHSGRVSGRAEKQSTVSIPPNAAASLNGTRSRLSIPVSGLLSTVISQQQNRQPAEGSTGFSGFMPVTTANDGTDDDHSLRIGMFEYGGGLSSLLNPSYQLSPQSVNTVSENNNRRVIINSRVVTASVNNYRSLVLLPEGQMTNFTLYHLYNDNVKTPKCVYWNTTLTSWDNWGCHVTESTKEYTICTCNHLTSFAVLMDVTGSLEHISKIHQEILTYITVVGCSISIVCLIVCILVFSCFRALWNDRNTIHRNLCVCLLIGELLYVCGIDRVESQNLCIAVAVLLQYFFLAAFCWMLMEGYQLYRMLIKVFETEKSMLIFYYSISYGCPAIITAVSVGIRMYDYGTEKYCWINVHSSTIWAFAGPVALVIIVNVIFLGLALKAVLNVSSSRQDKSTFQRLKGWLKGSTMLLSLLGITWIFGFCFTIQPAALYFAYIFAISNSLQGVFIFVFHVILNEKCHSSVIRSIRRTCPNLLPRKGDSLASNSTGSTNLKKLSDSIRNSNSLAVGLKSIDTNLGRPNSTFFINHALASNPPTSTPPPLYNRITDHHHHRHFTPNTDRDDVDSGSAAISMDKSHFAPIIVQRDPHISDHRHAMDDYSANSTRAVRQRYSKNSNSNDSSSEMTMTMNNNGNHNYLDRSDIMDGMVSRNHMVRHVLTIPTGDRNGNEIHTDLLNTLGRSKNDDFVGHF